VGKRDKLRRKLRNNPNDATMQEVETLLFRFGFQLERVSGSHHIYRYKDEQRLGRIVVPLHGRKVGAVYVKQAIELLDELFPEHETDDADSTKDENDE
jgi:predicted RNA binding protein YcfA (HicA-like mRNA interferase family)